MNADDAMPLSDVMVVTLERLVAVAICGAAVANIDGFYLVGTRTLRTARALGRRGFAEAHAVHADYFRVTDTGRRALASHQRIAGSAA